MLFYDPYAEIISEDATPSNDEPLTIGLFGLWGAGKSTLLHLIQDKYEEKDKVICVNINAWMFEGYEDAKTAVMEALLHELEENSLLADFKSKFKLIRKKVDLFKVGTTALSTAAPFLASMVTGNPLPVVLSLPSGAESIGKAISSVSSSLQTAKEDYLKEESDEDTSTVNEVRKFREDFEKTIEATNVKRIVVLLDDLDRCQPDRIIETLEAIKLFLSVKKMTFIIAADENVIQYSIKKKYPSMDGFNVELDKEYIEKLIQLPITIPELSEKDIENYLTILVYQNFMSTDDFESFATEIFNRKLLISEDVIKQETFESIIYDLKLSIINSPEYEELMNVIINIRGIVSTTLNGNPRQAKRFLNTFVTKRRLAQIYYSEEEINPEILAKLLVLHKLDSELFNQLNEWNKEFDTENKRFREMRCSFEEETSDSPYSKWHRSKIAKWVNCPPVELERVPLNKYFYLTRDILESSSYVPSSISEQARKLLAELGSGNIGLLPSVIEKIKKLSVEDIDGILNTMIRKIEEGDVTSGVYSKLFVTILMLSLIKPKIPLPDCPLKSSRRRILKSGMRLKSSPRPYRRYS